MLGRHPNTEQVEKLRGAGGKLGSQPFDLFFPRQHLQLVPWCQSSEKSDENLKSTIDVLKPLLTLWHMSVHEACFCILEGGGGGGRLVRSWYSIPRSKKTGDRTKKNNPLLISTTLDYGYTNGPFCFFVNFENFWTPFLSSYLQFSFGGLKACK